MIWELVTASFTLVMLGGLWLADRIEKRSYEADEPKVWFEPYHYPSIQDKCPMCGVAVASHAMGQGPAAPEACYWGDKCSGFPVLHHHIKCTYCHGKWMRLTKAAEK